MGMLRCLAALTGLLLVACAPKPNVGYKTYESTHQGNAKQVFDIPLLISSYEDDSSCWFFMNIDGKAFLDKKETVKQARIELSFFEKQLSRNPLQSIDTVLSFMGDSLFDFRLTLEKEYLYSFMKMKMTDVHRNVYVYSEGFLLSPKQPVSPLVLKHEGRWMVQAHVRGKMDVVEMSDRYDSIPVYRYPLDCDRLPSETELLRYEPLKRDTVFYLKKQEDVQALGGHVGMYYKVVSQEEEFMYAWSQCQPDNEKNAINYLKPEPERRAVSMLEYQKFWFDIAKGDSYKKDRLIQEFENRVEWANQHFSSYFEGWKTHRGWLYIVLGPPSRIEYSLGVERWFYNFSPNEDGQVLFLKNPNGIHPNDYELDWRVNLRYELQKGERKWLSGAVDLAY